MKYEIYLGITESFAELEKEAVGIASVFTSGMVFQQGVAVPAWGSATPWHKVMVRFADQEKVTTADTEGRWKGMLDSLTACADPCTLRISSTHNQQPINIDDVLVGQVVVTCPGVSHPKAVRYAWADNPAANLYNRDGLPASPFRAEIL